MTPFILVCYLSSSLPNIGTWSTLEGGQSQALAANRGRLVALNGNSAVWWQDGETITVALPGIPVDGSRWDGEALQVGPGRLDLGTRRWTPSGPFADHEAFLPPRPGSLGTSVLAMAWGADRAALSFERSAGAGRDPGVVEVRDQGGATTLRLAVPNARALAFVGDRLVVGADTTRIYAPDGTLVAEIPGMVARLRSDGRTLAVVRMDGAVALVDPASGATLGTLAGRFLDAAVREDLVVALDRANALHVACRSALDEVRVFEVGGSAEVVAIDAATIVVAGAGGVRVGQITGGC